MKKIISHIEELRSRLILIIVALFILATATFFASDHLIKLLRDSIPTEVELVVTNPFEIFLAKIWLSIFVSALALIPIIVHQIIAFVRPGLAKKERKVLWFVPFSIVLFFSGFLLCFIFLIKVVIGFLAISSSGLGIRNLWSLNDTISFVFTLSFIFGLCFQLPLILLVLNKLNILKYKTLKEQRKIAYVLTFIVSAVITPTVDPLTQIAVAIPLIFLYEVSLLLIRIF